MLRILKIVAVLIPFSILGQQSQNVNPLSVLLKGHPEYFKSILEKKKMYDIQILYTQIDRDENNQPHFKTFQFDVDTNRYFYPASTVKFPVALLALEKLNDIGMRDINYDTPIYHDSVYSGQINVRIDTTSEGGAPSIAHYAKKIFIVSDNDAFNRLYEFVGQKEINEKLKQKGYHTRILHRLNRRATADENRHTEAIRFTKYDSTIYSQPMLINDSMVVSKKIVKGKGFYDDGRIVRKPFNFSYRNYFNIPDQHEMMKAVIFPTAVPENKRLNLTTDQRKLMLQYMSQLPTETLYPPYYKDTTYIDSYSKLFLYGSEPDTIPNSIRIFNKIGVAYGYSIDNAYIVDFDLNVEFLLTAIIYTNKDGIFNDDKYEYKTVGFPFLKNLGKVIYDYEKTRIKKFKPDLSEFKFDYELKRF